MGCCSPNKTSEFEFINNFSINQKKSEEENNSLNFNNEFNLNLLKHKIGNENLILSEINIEENNEKIKYEKDVDTNNDIEKNKDTERNNNKNKNKYKGIDCNIVTDRYIDDNKDTDRNKNKTKDTVRNT